MSNFIKYPRTPHLPWSLGRTSDDKVLSSIAHFLGEDVVVTEKMDGENTSIYKNGLHARSLDSKPHESRDMVRALWGKIGYTIPDGWRICGENLYAKHSIYYKELSSYFMAFSIWNEFNECLSWSETLEYCELIGVNTVPVLYSGQFDEELLQYLSKSLDLKAVEGYVVRLERSFKYENFSTSVAKFVRENHVQTNNHWMHSIIEKNLLGEADEKFEK